MLRVFDVLVIHENISDHFFNNFKYILIAFKLVSLDQFQKLNTYNNHSLPDVNIV